MYAGAAILLLYHVAMVTLAAILDLTVSRSDAVTSLFSVQTPHLTETKDVVTSKSQEERPNSFIESLNFCGATFFPSVFTTTKIATCIPVTVVPVERSFSTLKRLKTYLRNTMGEERLNGLALLNVHRGIQLDIGEPSIA